jgi:Arc/MetJ family transcription regulator
LAKASLIMHIDIRGYPVGDGFMKITIDIEEELFEKATKLTGIREKTSLVKLGLEALITRETRKRLAKLVGTEKKLESIRRR